MLGATEFAARLPSLVFTLATILLVMAFGYVRFNRSTALLAGLILMTCPLVQVFSRVVIFDATLMFWVSAACITLHLSWERRRLLWLILGWAAAGFAVLTKGPVGLALPLLVSVTDAVVRRERVRRLFHPAGIAVFILVVGPWFLAVTLRHPEFPHYALVRETYERLFTDNRTGSFYSMAAFLITGSLPWINVLFLGARQLIGFWRERLTTARTEVFLLLWILVPLLFFTLSASKRPGYILPVLPAVALLCARLVHVKPRLLRYGAWIAAGIGFLLGVILLFGSGAFAPHIYVSRIAQALYTQGPAMGVALIAAGGMALFGASSPRRATAGLAMLPIAAILGVQGILAELGEYRSARSLARAIEKSAPGVTQIIGVEAYAPSLPYYLEKPIILATTKKVPEIPSEYIHQYAEKLQNAPHPTLYPEHWWQQVLTQCAEPAVFLVEAEKVEKREALAASLPLIIENPGHAVYGPCKPAAR
ncbi:MAG: phospholipid carrier-dependent glycosyltransferase [Candidatus Competibacteraceae bacterium]|nr:phospholipid carrier-dependent glycosyltransferase [Candidatus Competibacteraceae bacterium]